MSAPKIHILVGNIVDQETDAIVNSTNEMLIAGGGVCGVIHRSAGPDLEKATKNLGGCKTGEAKYTAGFNLKAKFVVHTVAPRSAPWEKYDTDKKVLLSNCYYNCLRLAKELKIKSISFPSLGTGVYGWSHEDSVECMSKGISEWLNKNKYDIEISIVLSRVDLMGIYQKRLIGLI